jgi:aminoacyl tRNA synthase complex-interacting multifunctional protein 1
MQRCRRCLPPILAALFRLQIAAWVSFRNTQLRPLMDDKLAELNASLATKTYVAGGTRPSLADLVLYAAAAPAAAGFPVAQHSHFANLLRWYDLLHHTVDGGRLFPAPSFQPTRYAAPPPPPPPEPKAAKNGDKAAAAPAQPAASSSNGGDKKAGKKADGAAAPAAAPPAARADAGGKADKKVRWLGAVEPQSG